MGMTPAPEYCYFTDLPTRNFPSLQRNVIDYSISVNERSIMFCLSATYDWRDSSFVKENIHIIRGLIFNDQWPRSETFYNEDVFTRIINSSSFPRTPKEKSDNLFLNLFKLQKVDGEAFNSTSLIFSRGFWARQYFKNQDEYDFYLKALRDQELINLLIDLQSGTILRIEITFKGLNYQIKLTESGARSNNCFIAMSFDQKNMVIRQAIKESVTETRFIPILIDEQHLHPEKTINDEIIANIKKSKFCISDFTDQRDGVYFEAGYALGRGLKVIYTCEKSSFKDSHFDINHFPHIIYETPDELKAKLKTKIEAWIS